MEKMSKEGVHWMRASNERGPGSQMLYQRIQAGKFYISESCEHLIRTLPILRTDEKKSEEYEKCGYDHFADAVRYGSFTRPNVMTLKRQPKGIRLPTMNDLMRPSKEARSWI